MSEKKEKQEITEVPDKLEEMEIKYKRALADYQNLLKQVERDKSDLVKYATAELITDFLPVYDYLKMSLAHADVDNEWVVGVKHVLTEFKKVLDSAGVTDIITVDVKFDPHSMTAVATEETDQAELDEYVAKEVKPGYKLHDRVLVPAVVVVYKLTSSKVES